MYRSVTCEAQSTMLDRHVNTNLGAFAGEVRHRGEVLQRVGVVGRLVQRLGQQLLCLLVLTPQHVRGSLHQ